MTMLISETSPVQTKKHRAPKDIMIDDAVYDIVESFYPGQILPLYLQPKYLMNIMNCGEDEGYILWRKIRDHYSDESDRLLIPYFCDYMDVDELWIYLFIASLKPPYKDEPRSLMTEEQEHDGSLTGKPPLTMAQLISKFKKGLTTLSPETLRERAITWEMLYPQGEPQYKRLRPYHVFIYADEVAAIYKISLHKAQDMLREVREDGKMRKRAPVSIKKFCHYYKEEVEEDEIRKALASMYGEEE